MKKELFSLLIIIIITILLTCSSGYSMKNKQLYSSQNITKIDTMLDHPEFPKNVKNLEQRPRGASLRLMLRRAIKNEKKRALDIMLNNPLFRLTAEDFTKILEYAITKENKYAIKAILQNPDFKIYGRYGHFSRTITKKNETAIKAILECLEDTFANPWTLPICYSILEYAKKPEHAWIITLMPDKPHPNNLHKLILRAIREEKDFIAKLILNHLKFKPDFATYLHTPECKLENSIDILIYAIKDHEEPLIKITLKHLEDHSVFQTNDFKRIIKTAIQHEYDYIIETMLKRLEYITFESYLGLNIFIYNVNIYADILTLGIIHKKEYIITTMLNYLEKIKDSYTLEDIFLCAIEHRNDLVSRTMLKRPDFEPRNLTHILLHAIEHDNEPVIKEISQHSRFTKSSLNFEKILAHAFHYKNLPPIQALLKHSKCTKKDLSWIYYRILSDAIKHNFTPAKTLLLSEPYIKNFNEILLYAILQSPRNTSVVDTLLQHPQYEPDFIMEEIIKQLEDPQFKPKNSIDILIYAIENQKEPLIKVMLKYLEDHPKKIKSPYDLERTLICAIKHKNKFVIKTVLKHPDFQPGYYINSILMSAIEHDNELVIKEISQYPRFTNNFLNLKGLLANALRYKNLSAIEVLLKHPEFEKLESWDWDFEEILILAMKLNHTLIIKTLFKHPDHDDLCWKIRDKIFIPAIEQNNEFVITILLDLLRNPHYKIHINHLKKLFKLSAKHKNSRIIHAILDHNNFTLYYLKNMLIYAIEHNYELAITIMLKYLETENKFAKKDLSETCYTILSYVIKHNNTLVQEALLGEPYTKFFNKMLMCAILESPRDTSVIDVLLQNPSYKPNFILEEVLKHLENPKFKPKDRKDILIYAIINKKDHLAKVMLKYLGDNLRFGPGCFQYIIRTAMKHENDFVIKAMLKYLENPKFQTNSYSGDRETIILDAIKHKKEFVIQAMLKYLEEIKKSRDLKSIFTCAIKYNHEFLINKILEHPAFKFLVFFKTTAQYAIKHNNDILIKKVLEHPKLETSHLAFNIILKHALEQNSNSLIEAIFKYLKQYFQSILLQISEDSTKDT